MDEIATSRPLIGNYSGIVVGRWLSESRTVAEAPLHSIRRYWSFCSRCSAVGGSSLPMTPNPTRKNPITSTHSPAKIKSSVFSHLCPLAAPKLRTIITMRKKNPIITHVQFILPRVEGAVSVFGPGSGIEEIVSSENWVLTVQDR